MIDPDSRGTDGESQHLSINEPELRRIAYLLMGAAYADGDCDGREKEVIHDILGLLVPDEEMPDDIDEYLDAFDPKTFDLQATCDALDVQSAKDRRSLLSLVAKVTEADEIHDYDEDAYIRKLARALGAKPQEYKDLTMEVISISALNTPPPIPEKARQEVE